jgi:dipeptidyl aminopeptidase/acylaminoacyl peptidase
MIASRSPSLKEHRMRALRHAVLAVIFVLSAQLLAAGAGAEALPVEAFGTRPLFEDPKLSPAGDLVAATMNAEGKPVLAIINLTQRGQGMKMIRIGEHRVRWYRWAGPDRLLISLRMKAMLSGFEGYATRLVVYQPSSGKATYLGYTSQGIEGDRVIHVAKDGSSALLVLERVAFSYPAVYRADLSTGTMSMVVEPKEPILEWYADPQGDVRGGLGYEGGHVRLYAREPGGSFFRHVAGVRGEEYEGEIDTIRIPSIGGKSFVVTNQKTGRFGLYEFDWKTAEVGRTVFEHPTADIDEFTLLEDGSGIEAVYYVDDRHRVEWFDPTLKQIQQEIDEALPGRMNWITSASTDRTKIIVRTTTASDPGAYFLYDRPQEQMARLATPYETLTGKALSPVSVVTYKARDGLEIPAYLTLPAGREAKGIPLVVLPHGGPYARDALGFDYWAQFMANRGYAVLQPNFRGSTGYGKEYLEKGFGQWGRAMQDDLTDGVQWLAREGTIDPKRVCIAGGSYGGYAALMGSILTPDLYRCAISWAGVTDLDLMMQHDKMHNLPGRYRAWRERVRGQDRKDLDEVSPVKLASRIAIPVLVMHGTDDENVPIHQGRAFNKAALKAKKPVEFLEFDGTGHHIESTADRVKFLAAVEGFLAKHNPAH